MNDLALFNVLELSACFLNTIGSNPNSNMLPLNKVATKFQI